ncbi:hypothetical protein T02_1950 [Trichinella nativa]|uniref:Uncharacterized protein n=1 Tax=Trichinella nativa TaxID=6335 RepID=A0A0V1LG61_9BILA|nr:hypothetical protein T02_1950 [Trichinella nativa]
MAFKLLFFTYCKSLATYNLLKHDASKHALEMLQLEIRISIKHAQLVQKIFYKILKTVYEFIVCLGSMYLYYEFHLKSQLFTFLSSISMKILPTFCYIADAYKICYIYSKSLVYENVGAEQQQVSVAGDALMISLRCSCCNALAIDSQVTMSWEEAGLQVTTSIEQQQQTKDWPLPTAGQQFLTAPPFTGTATAISYKTLANRLLYLLTIYYHKL